MPNTHQQHPEDTILSGDLRVIRDLYSRGHVSLKIDGAPAIVWGHYQGRFFVCTKAAFNKKKIRLCYDTHDINTHFGHQEDVANMLFLMLKFLDRDQFPGVYQGDFMGFGGTDTFKTNTLTYVFPEVVSQKLVIAPHTVYTVSGKLSDSVGSPLTELFVDDDHIKWCQPSVDFVYQDIEAPKIDLSNVNFMTPKESFVAQQQINSLIASGQMIEDRDLNWILGDIYLANLYQLVTDLKDDLMSSMIVHDAPKTYLPNGYEVVGEGFVFYSESGRVYKLVDRPVFSYTNFTEGKFN
jgi:hypothetical protein|tara:strand:+ start:92 stop:976 length:885 start_codon:yes stop_codon:yes gene_type:complete